ncbi:hypothetical protein WA538_004643, partial [Blastocystis sp. DL]
MERLLNLKYINLVNNQIESFPYFLGRLPSLEVILFDQNPYTNVSKEFIAQSPFTLLPALRQYVFDHKDLEDGAMAANAVDVSQFPLLHLSSINDYISSLAPVFQRHLSQHLPSLPDIADADSVPAGDPADMENGTLSLAAFADGALASHAFRAQTEGFAIPALRHAVCGVLYGAAIGDAISLGSEYMTRAEVEFHYGACGVVGGNRGEEENREEKRVRRGKEETVEGKEIMKEKEKEGKEIMKGKEKEGKEIMKEKEMEGKEIMKGKEKEGKEIMKEKEKEGKEIMKEKEKEGKEIMKEKEMEGKEIMKGKEKEGKEIMKEKEMEGKEKKEELAGKEEAPSEHTNSLPCLSRIPRYDWFVRDRHRIRWVPGDWSEKTDLAIMHLAAVLRAGSFSEQLLADIITRYKFEGVTLFHDEAGFGLTKTLGILANTKGYSDDPITYSKNIWIQSQEHNLESQCVPHTIVLSLLYFDDETKLKNVIIGSCKTTHYDLRCIGVCLLISTLLSKTIIAVSSEQTPNPNPLDCIHNRRKLVIEISKTVKTYFHGKKDMELLKRILLVDDDWSEVLRIRDYIRDNTMGEIFECCLFAVFFFIYDIPYIDAIMRVFMEGGSSCVNNFVVGAIIGAKKGVNHVVLGAPLLVANLIHRDYLDAFINKLLDAIH